MSLGAACGDPVFCCWGTASADLCDFISVHRIISLGTAFGDSVFCSVAEHLLSSGTASGDPSTYILHLISSHFSGHRLWRLSFPPAIDFVASFLWLHVSGQRLWRLSFLLFGDRQWRPLSTHFMSSHHFSGHRLWRLSFLFCHRTLTCKAWAPPVATFYSI